MYTTTTCRKTQLIHLLISYLDIVTFRENVVTATENPRYWNYCWLKLLKTAFFWEKQFAPEWRHVVKSFFVRSEHNKLMCISMYSMYMFCTFFIPDGERKLDHFFIVAKNHLIYHLDYISGNLCVNKVFPSPKYYMYCPFTTKNT